MTSARMATDGDLPCGSLIFDTAGNLYGTTQYGGDGGRDFGQRRDGIRVDAQRERRLDGEEAARLRHRRHRHGRG